MDWSERFYYDETSPTFLRYNMTLIKSNGMVCVHVIKDKVAGCYQEGEHARVTVDDRGWLCHIIIWNMFYGEIPAGLFVDHKDQDRTNNCISNLRLATRHENNANKGMYSCNKSGINGVHKIKHKNWEYWIASWHELDHKKKNKWFSTNKYGEDQAFKLACEYRCKMIEKLIQQGAGYTENHGT